LRLHRASLGVTAGAIGLLLAASAPEVAGRELGPRKALVTEEALIYYRTGDEANARRVADAIRANLPRITAELGTQFAGPIRLYLCVTLAEFDQLAGGSPGPWVLGQALPGRKVVIVKSMPAASTLERLVLHELTHVVLGQALGPAEGAAPDWLVEGMAVFLSGEWGPAHETTLATAVSRGRLIPLSELADGFPEDPMHSGLAYAESGSFVQFLAAQPGDRPLARLVAALRETLDVDSAVQQVFGRSTEDLRRQWEASVARSAGRQALCGDVGNTIFAAMALLVIAVFLLRQVRRRRRIGQTEDDEEPGLFPWEEESDF
jgi:hypothetical protein